MKYQEILNQVGNEFKRKELLKVTLEKGYAVGYADKILEWGTLTGNLERLGGGKYRVIGSLPAKVKEAYQKGLSYRQIANEFELSKTKVAELINY